MTIPNGNQRGMLGAALVNLGSAIQSWAQPMVFDVVTKVVVGGEVVETETAVNFLGVIQPLTARQLLLKPEGQRAWSWFLLHADPSLTLNVDDVVVYGGKQTRVMAVKDFGAYGYVEYHLVQDWTGAGP